MNMECTHDHTLPKGRCTVWSHQLFFLLLLSQFTNTYRYTFESHLEKQKNVANNKKIGFEKRDIRKIDVK